MPGDILPVLELIFDCFTKFPEESQSMQFLSDIIGAPVDRPTVLETTALGAAWLAGMKAGVLPAQEEFAKSWARERRFDPKMGLADRDARYARWKRAVEATMLV